MEKDKSSSIHLHIVDRTDYELNHTPLHLYTNTIHCFLCTFGTVSKFQLTEHIRNQHNDFLFSRKSDHPNLKDKDPCLLCAHCEFMTYSHELFDKHCNAKHHEEPLNSLPMKKVSRLVSVKVRQLDTLFYSSLFYHTQNVGAFISDDNNVNEDDFEIPASYVVEENKNCSNFSPLKDSSKSKADQNIWDKFYPETRLVTKNIVSGINDIQLRTFTENSNPSQNVNRAQDIIYCLSCQYSCNDTGKMRFHMFKNHPTRAAIAKYSVIEKSVKFICIKECNFSTTDCEIYAEHLVECCTLHQNLSENERKRLQSSLKSIIDVQEKHSLQAMAKPDGFVSSVNDSFLHQPTDVEPNIAPIVQVLQTRCSLEGMELSQQECNPVKCENGTYDIKPYMKERSEQINDIHDCHICPMTISTKDELAKHLLGNKRKPSETIQSNYIQSFKSSKFDQEKDMSMLLETSKNSAKCADQKLKSQNLTLSFNNGKLKPNKFNENKTDTDKRLAKEIQFGQSMESNLEDTLRLCSNDRKRDGSHGHKTLLPEKLTHSEGAHPYKCIDCDRVFSRKYEYTEHMFSHSGQRPFTCNTCGRKFTCEKHLTVHVKTHAGDGSFKCKECGLAFVSISKLTAHIKLHSVFSDIPFKCEVCGKVFTQEFRLRRHINIHLSEKPYKCSVCEKGFSDKANLTKHIRVHTGEKPYGCSHCGKCFNQSSCLTVHERIHTGERPYMCYICGEFVSSCSDLNRHLKYHSGLKPFKCNECDKTFAQKRDLRRHVLIHTGERPYQCTICGNTFNRMDHLNYHMTTHNKDKRL